MSLPIPLAVRLKTSRATRTVTRDLRDLSFRWSDPGGYATCTISLDRPLSIQPEEIAYYGDLTVFDARTGGVVWDGRLEDPGRSAGDGQVWQLTASGGQAHTKDRAVPLIYIDRDLSRWQKSRGASGEQQNTQVSAGEAVTSGDPALTLSFPTGMTVPTNGACTAVYMALEEAGQNLAVFDYAWDAGLTSASWQIRGFSSGSNVVRTQSATTAGSGFSTATVGTGAFVFGDRRPFLQFRWTGAASGTGTGDIVWANITGIVVRATTYDKFGVEKSSGYSSTHKTILASNVVEDLVGRLLPQYDGANATLDVTTEAIEQLAYVDPVTPNQVLTDMLAIESAYTWRVWERNSAGLFRFEWVVGPSTVRYEASTADGYESQGSADGLYNRVSVRWRDGAGRVRTTVRTSTSPLLSAAGLTRQGAIDLGDEVGSPAAANRAGDQWLADRTIPANAGRLRVARPIMDISAGRMVQPWEIRPGLIRVRGILPRPDALNTTVRDGVSVMRIVGVDYSASDNSATLELDSYAPSIARQIAKLTKTVVSKRRR